MKSPKDVFQEFLQMAKERMDEAKVYETMDRIRDDALEATLIEKGIITAEDVDKHAALKLERLIEFLKTKPVKSPMQQGEVE